MTYVRGFIKRRHSSTLIEHPKTNHTELVENTETFIIQSAQQSVYHQEIGCLLISKPLPNNIPFWDLIHSSTKIDFVGGLLKHFNYRKTNFLETSHHTSETTCGNSYPEISLWSQKTRASLTADMSAHPSFGLSVVSNLHHQYYINMIRVKNSEKELTFKRWISYQENGFAWTTHFLVCRCRCVWFLGWFVICRKKEVRLTERDGHRSSRRHVSILIYQRPSTIYSCSLSCILKFLNLPSMKIRRKFN